MLPTEPKVGWLFRYSYLWHWQHLEGREEGDKNRPVLVLAIVVTREDGTRAVRVLPVTHSPPSDPQDAVEISAATKRRLGLDDERSWIALTESDRFVWPGPDVRRMDGETGYYGALPPAITARCHQLCLKRSSAGLSSRRGRNVIVRRPEANSCPVAVGLLY